MSYKFLLNFFYTNREETENLLSLCLDLSVKYMKTYVFIIGYTFNFICPGFESVYLYQENS